jgi:hypothetical protein
MADEINLAAKTDRELLIMVVDRLNSVCLKVNKVDKAVHGNGKPGLQTHVMLLWVMVIVMALGGKDALAIISKAVIR